MSPEYPAWWSALGVGGTSVDDMGTEAAGGDLFAMPEIG